MTLSRQPTHDFGISGLSSYDFFPVAFFTHATRMGPVLVSCIFLFWKWLLHGSLELWI